MRSCATMLAMGATLLALAGCNSADVGYVEVRALPASADPALYLDNVKLGRQESGVSIMRQKVGTTRLQADRGGGDLAPMCNVVVRKNRITTITVLLLDHTLRCQCRNLASTGRDASCVS